MELSTRTKHANHKVFYSYLLLRPKIKQKKRELLRHADYLMLFQKYGLEGSFISDQSDLRRFVS